MAGDRRELHPGSQIRLAGRVRVRVIWHDSVEQQGLHKVPGNDSRHPGLPGSRKPRDPLREELSTRGCNEYGSYTLYKLVTLTVGYLMQGTVDG